MRASFSQMFAAAVVLVAIAASAVAQNYAQPDGYDHARYVELPVQTDVSDIVRVFPAYISVFDGPDDDDGNGTRDALGIPEYVTYHLQAYPGVLPAGPDRPSWSTDRALRERDLIPTDATYRHSQAFRRAHPNWYVRGHLCMKQHAWRISAEADRLTHTMLNAVPQRQEFNAGIWLDLEYLTADWADRYGEIWIITGPVFYRRFFDHATQDRWLGEAHQGEMLIAIPDALFKIIIRETDDGIEVLAFMYPQDSPQNDEGYDHLDYAVSIDEIEALTGHDFLSMLDDAEEAETESVTAGALWPR